jgi:Zn-dependent oligopeptidase
MRPSKKPRAGSGRHHGGRQALPGEILSVGGSRPALESFTAFRGREPSIDALLRHSGMAA